MRVHCVDRIDPQGIAGIEYLRGYLRRGKIVEVTDCVGKWIYSVDLYCIFGVGGCDVESQLRCTDAKIGHIINRGDVHDPRVSAEAVFQSTLEDVGGADVVYLVGLDHKLVAGV